MGRSLFFWFGALLAFGLWVGYNRLQDGTLGHRIQQLRATIDGHLPARWGGRQQENARSTVFYRWRDAQGVEHLSDTPHPGAERLVVRAPRSIPAPPAALAGPGSAAQPHAWAQPDTHGAAEERPSGSNARDDGRPDLCGIRQGLERKLQGAQDQEDRQIDRDSGH
jgi:hypothetical protein